MTAVTHRLRSKTQTKAAAAVCRQKKVPGRKTQAAKARGAAVKAGAAPVARRCFALFVKENSMVRKGASQAEHKAELVRLGAVWRRLPKEEQDRYRVKSAEEFGLQREGLASHGIFVTGKRPCDTGAAAQPPQQPACIGPYVLEPFESAQAGNVRLGCGSYGKVYKSKSPMTGQQLAVKAFYGRDAGEDAEHEVALYQHMVANLLHSEMAFFATIHNYDVASEPYPWIAMDFCGPSLAKTLNASPKMPCSSVQTIAVQLKTALQFVHRAMILHLDVKPANILWVEQLQLVKLCDFGMAERRDVPASRLRFAQYVTVPYRPPELVAVDGQKEPAKLHRMLTPGVDMWSYGCTIYNVATGTSLMSPLANNAKPYCEKTLSLWCTHWAQLCKQQLPKTAEGRVWQLRGRLVLARQLQGIILKVCNPTAAKRQWPSVAECKAGLEGCK